MKTFSGNKFESKRSTRIKVDSHRESNWTVKYNQSRWSMEILILLVLTLSVLLPYVDPTSMCTLAINALQPYVYTIQIAPFFLSAH